MNYVDSITDLYRKYMESRSIIARMKNSLSICSSSSTGSSIADLDNDLVSSESSDDNWPPRSELSCTCETEENEPHRCTTIITFPEGLKNFTPAATITVTKSLDVVAEFSSSSCCCTERTEQTEREDAEPSLRRRLEHMRREKERAVSQFQRQNFQVQELSESLQRTEERLREEVKAVQKKLRDATDVVQAARAEEKQARSELLECKNELEKSCNESSELREQSCKLQKQFEQSQAIARKLQNMLRDREAELVCTRTELEESREKIDCAEKANREVVNQERRQSQLALEMENRASEGLKSKLEGALEQLSEWKEKCRRLELRDANLAGRENEWELKMERFKKEAEVELQKQKKLVKELNCEKEELVHKLTRAKQTSQRGKQEVARLSEEIENLKVQLEEALNKNVKEAAAWRQKAALAECSRKSEESALRKKELISERRLSDASAELGQIKAENGRLKIQLQQTIKRLEGEQRANSGADTKLAALSADNEKMKLALREMAEQHERQVDDLRRTNDGLLEKICQIREHFALRERTRTRASVRFESTRLDHHHHDSAFCAFKEPS